MPPVPMELEEGPNNDLEKLNVSTNAVSGFVIFTNLKVLSFEATMLLLALNHLKPILLLFATIVESVPEQILTLEGTVGFEGVAAMVIAENFMVSFCKFSSPVNAVKALKLIDPPFFKLIFPIEMVSVVPAVEEATIEEIVVFTAPETLT